jgi:hypothetical protein
MLRHIEFTNRPEKEPWSLRQYTVYHKYNMSPGEWFSTMILVGMPQRGDDCVTHHANQGGDIRDSHPFELHILFIETALASWRPYILDLSVQVTDIASATGKHLDPIY